MAQTITVTGGNLFDIALQYLGDARGAWQIAQVNGLTDFWLTGLVTLTIPDPQDVNDGVPPQ